MNISRVKIEYPSSNAVVPENYKPYDQDYQTSCIYNLEDWTTYGARECIAGAVYGGSENGHVNDSAYVHLKNGLVGHAVYGGGKGSGTYTVHVVPTGPGEEPYDEEHYCITAGKVFGNTHVLMEGGYVVRNVYGGGNAASVGKANFLGYGETGAPIANNGRCIVEIKGGTLGMLPVNKTKPGDVFKDDIPYGSVFGGCRGFVDAKCDVQESEESRMSYASSTKVIIGTDNGGPTIRGSVYGGGQDGHVRHTTDVTINKGEIGVEFGNPVTASTTVGSNDPDSEYWVTRGNVFGGGSGISTYKDANNVDTYSLYAGSVLETTNVTVKGGTIHRNVYGGGNLAYVGNNLTEGNITAIPGTSGTNGKSLNLAKVTIMGGQVGISTDVNGSYTVTPGSGNGGREGDDPTQPEEETFKYGGDVFGGGCGKSSDDFWEYCNVDSTHVVVGNGIVYGDVYGGAEDGHVKGDTYVAVHSGANIGTIGNTGYDGNVYGGGKGSGDFQTFTYTSPTSITEEEFRINPTCGRVGGNTQVIVDGGTMLGSVYGGGSLALIGVDENGRFLKNATAWNPAQHGNARIKVSGSTIIGTSNSSELLNTDYSVGDIFGSGRGDIENYDDILAGRTTNTSITIIGSPTIHGAVFGGGEMSSIGWWDTIIDGTTHLPLKTVFLSGTGEAEITIGREGETDNPSIGTWDEFKVLPSSSSPYVSPWTIFENGQLIHTCTGNVFGGGQGEVSLEDRHWNSFSRSRKATITINGGRIMGYVYGGSEQGSVADDTHVTINGANVKIGTLVDVGTGANGNAFRFGGVFGGGYGSDNPDEANNITFANDSTGLVTVAPPTVPNTHQGTGSTFRLRCYSSVSHNY